MKDHAKAQYAIGYFCEMGIGCVKNMEKAMRWYKLAANLGDERALQRIGGRADNGTMSSSSSGGNKGGLFGFLGRK